MPQVPKHYSKQKWECDDSVWSWKISIRYIQPFKALW
jgi:hypothetical protein